MVEPISREELDRRDAGLRRETELALNTVSVQIGAVEKLLTTRLDGLKWRMVAALVGGQVLTGAIASVIATRDPETPAHTAVAVLRAVGLPV